MGSLSAGLAGAAKRGRAGAISLGNLLVIPLKKAPWVVPQVLHFVRVIGPILCCIWVYRPIVFERENVATTAPAKARCTHENLARTEQPIYFARDSGKSTQPADGPSRCSHVPRIDSPPAGHCFHFPIASDANLDAPRATDNPRAGFEGSAGAGNAHPFSQRRQGPPNCG